MRRKQHSRGQAGMVVSRARACWAWEELQAMRWGGTQAQDETQLKGEVLNRTEVKQIQSLNNQVRIMILSMWMCVCLCEWMLPVCRCLQRPKESYRSLTLDSQVVLSPPKHCRCKEETQAIHKVRSCSEPLSHRQSMLLTIEPSLQTPKIQSIIHLISKIIL